MSQSSGCYGLVVLCIMCASAVGLTSIGRPDMVREGMICGHCGSSWRMRSVILAILTGLRLPHHPLPAIDADWSRIGLGCSDDVRLAAALSHRFRYVNTFLDEFPRLDISHPPQHAISTFEFVVTSDVLEHVLPPLSEAVDGLYSLVRPGGFAVVSVPVSATDGPCREHYSGLTSYTVGTGGQVEWVDGQGNERVDVEPEWHGGSGRTLAFRQFTDESFVTCLEEAGFTDVMPAPSVEGLGVPEIQLPGVFLARKSAE